MVKLEDLFEFTEAPQEVAVKVPGKLFIAGEYAILAPGHGALLIAVDQYLSAKIESYDAKENDFCLYSPTLQQSELKGNFRKQSLAFHALNPQAKEEWAYVKEALLISSELLALLGIDLQPFRLDLSSQLNDSKGAKYGFGSSGAVTVAVIEAFLAYHGLKPRKGETLFKLAVLALTRLGSRGSMADVATNIYGGWIYYQSFHRPELHKALKAKVSLADLLTEPWKQLEIKALTAPEDLQLAIGWTQEAASTENLVGLLNERKRGKEGAYEVYLHTIQTILSQLVQAFEQNNLPQIQKLIRSHRQALQELGRAYDLPIETPPLIRLIDIAESLGFAAKSSGAGGGDCGIAIGHKNTSHRADLAKAWQKQGIESLSVAVAPPRHP